MPINRLTTFNDGATRWLLAGFLAAIVCLVLPGTVWASSSHEGAEPCAQCHPEQATLWQDSPHGQVTDAHDEVSCEVCHGSYVADHPQGALMRLPGDNSCCQDCHTTPYEQWHDTGHATVGVQCASCHVPHSQETRLATEELCESCHREQAEHSTHHVADVHCADCHVSVATDPTTSDVSVTNRAAAPNHSFKRVIEACVGCHGPDIHGRVETAQVNVDRAQLSVMTTRAQELAYDLEDAKHTNRSLATMSVVSLGFGLGTGGVLGVIFVLVVGYVMQRREER